MADIEYFGIENKEAQNEIEIFIEENLFGTEFKVMTDDAREEEVKEYIKETLWAFRPEFIMSHLRQEVQDNMNPYEYRQSEKGIKKMTEELCESANGLILAMIEDLDDFVNEAVSVDGYGHFLSPYDGDEHEFEHDGETYYIYKQN